MIAVLAAAVSVAAAALVAVAGYADPWVLAAAVMFLAVVVALGWSSLLELPNPRGSAVLVVLTGAAGVGVAVTAGASSRPLAGFASVVAGAVLAAFGHELLRRDGRDRLVESITGTLSGQVVAVLAAGWLLLPDTRVGVRGVLVAAVAVAASRAVTALPLPSAVGGWVAFLAGAAAAGAVSVVVQPVETLTVATMGLAVAVVVAALDRLLVHQPQARHSVGLLASAVAPVAVAGTVAYAAVRLLGG